MQKKLSRLGWRNILIMLLTALMIANPLIVYFYMDSTMKSEISKREEQISELKEALEELSTTKEELEATINELRGEISSLSEILDEKEAELKKFMELFANASKLIEEKTEEIEELKRRVIALQRELETLSEGLAANASLISIYPWIMKFTEIKGEKIFTTLMVENNLDHPLDLINITYILLSQVEGVGCELATTTREDVFDASCKEQNLATSFHFLAIGDGLQIGERANLTAIANVKALTKIIEKVVIDPEPDPHIDKNYNQVSDVLEDWMIELSKINPSHPISVIIGFKDRLKRKYIHLFEEYGGQLTLTSELINGFIGTIPINKFWGYVSEIRDKLYFIDPESYGSLKLDESRVEVGVNLVNREYGIDGDHRTSIAFIDTGINANHSGFGGFNDIAQSGWARIPRNLKVVGWRQFHWNTATNNWNPSPRNPRDYGRTPHGSHVAGIAAGTGRGNPANRYIGIANDTKIVMVSINAPTRSFLEGLRWIENHIREYHIVAVSISWGYDISGNRNLERAVNRLVERGVVVVQAAGNEFGDGINITAPGRAEKIITVGAANGTRGVAYFSDNGPPPLPGRRSAVIKPDVIAPGVDVISVNGSTLDRYAGKSGTSMATPHVSGLAALLIDAVTDYDERDEDGDGKVDEDPWNHRDDDGDGLIDEDLANWTVTIRANRLRGDRTDERAALKIKSIILMTAYEVQGGFRVPGGRVGWIDMDGDGNFDDGDDWVVVDVDGNGRGTNPDLVLLTGSGNPIGRNIIFRELGYIDRVVDLDRDGIPEADVRGAYNRIFSADWIWLDIDNNAHVSPADTIVRRGRGAPPAFNTSYDFRSSMYPLNALRNNRPELNRGGKDRVEGYGMISADAAIDAVTKTICGKAEGVLGDDPDDRKVWARHIYMFKSAEYRIRLRVPSGADFDLYLYSSDYRGFGEPIIIKKSAKDVRGGYEQFTLKPPKDGIYYIVVKWVSGEGRFTLEVETRKKYTVMVYMAADKPGLDDLAFNDINELERAGQDGNVSILVYVDWHERNNGQAHVYHMTWLRDNRNASRAIWNTSIVSLPQLCYRQLLCMNLTEDNTGDPQSLIDFVNFSARYFYSEQYVLILWGDGDGWKVNERFGKDAKRGAGLLSDSRRAEGEDKPDALRMSELKEALKKIVKLQRGIGDRTVVLIDKLDLLMFDAPLMATVEVAHQVKDYVKHMVASQGAFIKRGFEPPTKLMDKESGGWNYTKIIKHLMKKLSEKETYYAKEFAKDLPSLGIGDIHSASSLDLSIIGNLTKAINSLAEQLSRGTRDYRKHLMSSDNVAERLRAIRLKVTTFGGAINISKVDYAYDLTSGIDSILRPRRYKDNDLVWGDMDYIDLKHFAELVLADDQIPMKYKSAAPQVIDLVEKAVLAEYHHQDLGEAYGLSIYFPYQQDRKDCLEEYDFWTPSPLSIDDYDSAVDFSKEAKNWPIFLHMYYTPIADMGFDTITAFAGMPIMFDGRGSSDTDASREFVSKRYVSKYEWDFGDGDTYVEWWYDADNEGDIDPGESDADDGKFDGTTTHIYTAAGIFIPRLTCTDDDGKKSEDQACILVLPPYYLIPFPPYPPIEGEYLATEASINLLYINYFTLKLGYGEFIDEEMRYFLVEKSYEAASRIEEGDYMGALEDVQLMYEIALESMVEGDEKENILQSLSDTMMLLEALEMTVYLELYGSYEEPYIKGENIIFPLTINYMITLPGEIEYVSSATYVVAATCPAPPRADP